MSLHTTRLPSAPPLALAIAMALGVAASAAQASEERFRLLPGSVMQNDDSDFDGTRGEARGLNYEVVQGYAIAEGDMVLGRIDRNGRLEVPFLGRGLGQRRALDRWPEGIVPYTFHPGLTEVQQGKVEEAIARINARTRVSLVPASDPSADGYDDYLLFEPSSGCASYVGRQRLPSQDHQSLWVADSCSIGSVVHEVSHAIGLFHEHTRADRDNYITVDWDNIESSKDFNFTIYDAGATMHGVYDYGSIMHYGEHYFSSNGKRTIVAPSNVRIGQRDALSADDVEAIDRMYATDLTLAANTLETERGLEIDISIGNEGDLGARGLLLRVLGEPGTDWQSVSAESGWNCLAHDEELRCRRSRLIEQASSRFTIVADPGTTTAAALAMRLESVTLDVDLADNRINDAALGAEVESDTGSGTPPASTSAPEEETNDDAGTGDGTGNETRSAPAIAAATGSAGSGDTDAASPGTSTASVGGSGAGGGGSAGFGIAVLLLPLLGRGRRLRGATTARR